MATNPLIPLQALERGPVRPGFQDFQQKQFELENLRRRGQIDDIAVQQAQRQQQDEMNIRKVLSAGLPDDQTIMQLKMLGLSDVASKYEQGIAQRNKAIAEMDTAQRARHKAEIEEDAKQAFAVLQAPPEQQPQLWDQLGTGQPYPGPEQLKFIVRQGQGIAEQITQRDNEEKAKLTAETAAQNRAKAPFELQKTIAEAQQATHKAQNPTQADTSLTQTELALRAAQGDEAAAKAMRLMQTTTGPQAIPGRDFPLPPDVEAQRLRMNASRAQQGRPVTSGDANRIADFDTSLNDLTTLRSTIPQGATGTGAKVGAMAPNWVTDLTGFGTGAKQKQAVIDRVKQVIGKTLEGGVLRKEDEYKYEKILPTIADTAAVVKTKLDGLEAAIRQRRQTLVDSLEDAGYSIERYQQRSNAAPTPAKPAAPKVGTIEGGYRFLGGNPADSKNWRKE